MQINGFSNLQLELIEWEDIVQPTDTWISPDEVDAWFLDRGTCIVDQIGFILAEDDHSLIMTDSYIESSEVFGNVTKIPKSVIRKRIKLTNPES